MSLVHHKQRPNQGVPRPLLRVGVRIFSIFNPLLLCDAASSPHFATSVCFTNVATVERIYLRDFHFRDFQSFHGCGLYLEPAQ